MIYRLNITVLTFCINNTNIKRSEEDNNAEDLVLIDIFTTTRNQIVVHTNPV